MTAAAAVQRWSAWVASATRPLEVGEACGDAAAWFPLAPLAGAPALGQDPAADSPNDCLLAIVDGLGHGPEAALAAAAALRTLADAPERPLPQQMQALDAALCTLRGAALGLVRVERHADRAQGGQLLHAGIGNTRAMRLRDHRLTRLPSQNGIVGGGLPGPVSVNRLDLLPGDWVLLYTDGLSEALQLPVLLPEWQRDPTLLCLHLLQHVAAQRDDAGVLVMHVGGA